MVERSVVRAIKRHGAIERSSVRTVESASERAMERLRHVPWKLSINRAFERNWPWNQGCLNAAALLASVYQVVTDPSCINRPRLQKCICLLGGDAVVFWPALPLWGAPSRREFSIPDSYAASRTRLSIPPQGHLSGWSCQLHFERHFSGWSWELHPGRGRFGCATPSGEVIGEVFWEVVRVGAPGSDSALRPAKGFRRMYHRKPLQMYLRMYLRMHLRI